MWCWERRHDYSEKGGVKVGEQTERAGGRGMGRKRVRIREHDGGGDTGGGK